MFQLRPEAFCAASRNKIPPRLGAYMKHLRNSNYPVSECFGYARRHFVQHRGTKFLHDGGVYETFAEL